MASSYSEEPPLPTKWVSLGKLNEFEISNNYLRKIESHGVEVPVVVRPLVGPEISACQELDLFTLRKAVEVFFSEIFNSLCYGIVLVTLVCKPIVSIMTCGWSTCL